MVLGAVVGVHARASRTSVLLTAPHGLPLRKRSVSLVVPFDVCTP
jgi:hypothetical protein